MNPLHEYALNLTRRELFRRAGTSGIGAAALATLLNGQANAAAARGAASASGWSVDNPLAPKATHLAPRAKNVIFMHMVGAFSQLDLFDYKPQLVKHDGELCPAELFEGKRFAFIRKRPSLLGTKYKFTKHGESGVELSELLPHLGEVADDIAVIKSLHTEQFNHAPAQLFFTTGFARFGRPSLGSWATYGLGSENRNLPAFVVMNTGSIAGAGNSLWGSGFLPTVYQGVEFRTTGDPVLFLSNPKGVADADRRRIVDRINTLNREALAGVGDPEIATRISQYEMAYRMQTAVPELMDITSEPAPIHAMYGTQPGRESFANNCLLARRLVERGVRFVQLYDEGWDHHGNIFGSLPGKCKQVDQPIGALIKDLKQRGLLDQTLVVFAAEFGRTPLLQSDREKPGRDHHKDAFSVWMAGGGVRGGVTYGRTDDLGYSVTENPVHVNDLHATILHLLGLDHESLTYKYQGRNFRLTDVGGYVQHDLIG